MQPAAIILFISLGLTSTADVQPEDLEKWISHMASQNACYSELGCFDLSSPWFSWSRPVPVLPQPAQFIDTKFYLLTRKNPYLPQRLQTRPLVDLSNSDFVGNRWLFFIVHGYMSHYDDDWILTLAYEYLQMFDANVILVDWSNGANLVNYIQVVANTRLVGAEMARLTSSLIQQGLSHPAKIHALGYSLGAQVIGNMANNITGLHRITGLDPAQPGFEGTDEMVHLDSTDAHFVDVIHTNGVPFLPGLGLGIRANVGHVDFFINGGETQPGCRKSGEKTQPSLDKKVVYDMVQKYLENYPSLNIRVDTVEELENLVMGLENEEPFLEPAPMTFHLHDFLSDTLASIVHYVACSHHLAPTYFIESMERRDCSFLGVPWEPSREMFEPENCTYSKCTEMGFHSILYPARGTFYVTTNQNPPFCREWHLIFQLED